MKIKMLTLMAGPKGVRKAGQVFSVSDDEALALIAGGYAEKVKAQEAATEPTEPSKDAPQEETPAEPAVETATRKRGEKKVKA